MFFSALIQLARVPWMGKEHGYLGSFQYKLFKNIVLPSERIHLFQRTTKPATHSNVLHWILNFKQRRIRLSAPHLRKRSPGRPSPLDLARLGVAKTSTEPRPQRASQGPFCEAQSSFSIFLQGREGG